MGQMTWRADDELIERVRRSARATGRSLNAYVTSVLDAATNPELNSDEATRVRERLAAAGILAPGGSPRRRPARNAVAKARRSAGKGVPLSEIVSSERR
ncbi:MAG: transcriptional regulator [Acidimicrobiia bacterium]|nr:transcriptional regulator [Acidimicrobiia bacterium]